MFRITKDHIGAGREGVEGQTRIADEVEGSYRFRLYDDDGELYYEGIATSWNDCELAHDFGRIDAGCTYSEVAEADGPFQPFIG